jgi:hypothetical protein
VPAAKALGKDAVAVLVFPRITRAGFVIGGQYGEGALLKGGKAVGYYSTAGASWGLQAGAQQFGYALFFMNENALNTLTDTNGFEVGVGPTVVVVDEGMARSVTTITANQDVYAFIFGQRGLMAGRAQQPRERSMEFTKFPILTGDGQCQLRGTVRARECNSRMRSKPSSSSEGAPRLERVGWGLRPRNDRAGVVLMSTAVACRAPR